VEGAGRRRLTAAAVVYVGRSPREVFGLMPIIPPGATSRGETRARDDKFPGETAASPVQRQIKTENCYRFSSALFIAFIPPHTLRYVVTVTAR
jgi:hypothetical protein